MRLKIIVKINYIIILLIINHFTSVTEVNLCYLLKVDFKDLKVQE
jgi:hypothetical protein